jgi:TorA maturation chaperone TorD
LFYAPPDADIVHGLLAAGCEADPSEERAAPEVEDASAPLGYADAFLALQLAARASDLDTLRQQYDETFIGAGKALVTPYTSGYAAPHAPDRHLVALRERLAMWGLGRRDSVFEVEDHVSAICDAMRWLIEAGRPLDEQRAFFDEFLDTPVGLFADAVKATAPAPFYPAAAALIHALLAIEKQSFALHAAE